MVHFRIHFSYPLLLLVFLFGAVMTALLYFRLSKSTGKQESDYVDCFASDCAGVGGADSCRYDVHLEIPNKENQNYPACGRFGYDRAVRKRARALHGNDFEHGAV